MDIAVVIVRLGLAVTLAVAAAAKLMRPALTRDTLEAFGVSGRLRAGGPFALAGLELVSAGLLLVRGTARVGAICALALLVVFTAVVARALAAGVRPRCSCFGGIHAKPISRLTLGRNASLIAGAVLVAGAGAGRNLRVPTSGTQTTVLIAGGVLLLVMVAHAFASYQLFRQNGRLLQRISVLEAGAGLAGPAPGTVPPAAGIAAGEPAPPFVLPDLEGRRRSLPDLLRLRRPLALAFLDPDCGACGHALTELAELRDRRAGELAVAVLTRGDASEARRRVNGYAFDGVLLQEGREVAELFGVTRVPSALVIGADGRVATPVAVGMPAIASLLESEPAGAGPRREEGN